MTYAEVNSKEREEVVKIVWGKMLELQKGYTWDIFQEITTIVSDWNSEHCGEDEIFTCEHQNENGEVDGLYLEDNYIVFND